MNKLFRPLTKPNLHGVSACRQDGIEVEVVRCDVGRWRVFMTRNDSVVAVPVQGRQDMPRAQAMAVARTLVA